MVSVMASQPTGHGFDTNCGQPLFVSLGKALNLTQPLTTHEYILGTSLAVELACDRLASCPGETLFSAACATETGNKHRRYGPLRPEA